MTFPTGGFESVLEYLTGEILGGRVPPGSRLPNERELATQLGASRSAVREALKVLQAQGVVTSHTGPAGGTRVATGQGPAFGRMMRLHVALDAISFAELTETRVVLERATVEAAPAQATEADLTALDSLVDDMSGLMDVTEFNELDTSFHLLLARLGANRLIRDLTVAIREAVAAPILEAERRVTDWGRLRERLNAEHRAIVSALRARDGGLAADLVERHIRDAHATLLP